MTTAMVGVTEAATIMAIKNGVAIEAIRNGEANIMVMGMEVIVLDISTPTTTHNLSMSRRQCTIHHSNHPASVCFFRLILVGRYRLKRAHEKV
jgi:hypothetical protein